MPLSELVQQRLERAELEYEQNHRFSDDQITAIELLLTNIGEVWNQKHCGNYSVGHTQYMVALNLYKVGAIEVTEAVTQVQVVRFDGRLLHLAIFTEPYIKKSAAYNEYCTNIETLCSALQINTRKGVLAVVIWAHMGR